MTIKKCEKYAINEDSRIKISSKRVKYSFPGIKLQKNQQQKKKLNNKVKKNRTFLQKFQISNKLMMEKSFLANFLFLHLIHKFPNKFIFSLKKTIFSTI